MKRTLLVGADVVLPDRVVSGLTLVLEGDRIVDLASGHYAASSVETRVNLSGQFILPGFIDVHVHGVTGADVLGGAGAVDTVARGLPRWGVTAFCPTTIACSPEALRVFLADVGRLRGETHGASARVLPAHLESNFISPDYCGAQPISCVRHAGPPRLPEARGWSRGDVTAFTATDILSVIDERRADIGIVTMAPEIEGGLDLVRRFTAAGLRVSMGHSGATYEQAQAAILAGARGATHLFNRMRPMTHREPGLVGAALSSEEVAAELICDGCHVHPAVMSFAIGAKGPQRMLAVSDGTAGSGLPVGSRARLGGQNITVDDVARLDDGTMAGSVLTMDRAFARLVSACGVDLVRAAQMCATTPARELGLTGLGVIAAGAIADLVVLDSHLQVTSTWIGGTEAWGLVSSHSRA